MFRLLTPRDFTTTPWRNGGGVTHEIARDGSEDWRWRLSIAEVASDGPFSHFAGMHRILTVIDGAGIDLVTADGAIPARPFAPVAFSGDLPIDGRLINGPIRDLNVICDPKSVSARVTLLRPGQIVSPPQHMGALLCVSGEVIADGTAVPAGAVALGLIGQISLGPDARALLVHLDPV